MNSAMVQSAVEPAIRASENTIISIAGSASGAIITSRLAPMPPKLGPDIHAGEREKEAGAAEEGGEAMRSPVQLNSRPVAKVGTRAAATQVAAKIR